MYIYIYIYIYICTHMYVYISLSLFLSLSLYLVRVSHLTLPHCCSVLQRVAVLCSVLHLISPLLVLITQGMKLRQELALHHTFLIQLRVYTSKHRTNEDFTCIHTQTHVYTYEQQGMCVHQTAFLANQTRQVCSSVLQCVAVRWSVLECVAMC